MERLGPERARLIGPLVDALGRIPGVAAVALGGERLADYPFQVLPLQQVRGGPPAWPARDPDYVPAGQPGTPDG
jgi:hypothetical protein